MAMNNRDRVGKAFDLLSEGLLDEVDEVMTRAYKTADWPAAWAKEDAQRRGGPLRTLTKHDVQVQLRAITEQGYHFKDVLSRTQQANPVSVQFQRRSQLLQRHANHYQYITIQKRTPLPHSKMRR